MAFGNDHAGYPMRQYVMDVLAQLGCEVIDCGTAAPEPVDFPDIAQAVCKEVLSGRAERGLLVCGTGVGAAIAANKVPGIRAAVCHDVHSAHQCVEHDDVNVMCLGAQIVGPWLAADLIRAFLQARFRAEPEFVRRVAKLAALERRLAGERAT
ncbi:RpiB/LacA/LacB family sugar-phosphate isomerase [Alicyclobacillus cellulosilyticus]|uniref:RpiB/LacA/LacB family sugar-phosphate isomerase n=1 Tax=Alicyclobacillus cellulosilyticus TaxID=1003997 RepID=UPI001E3AC692|nr:RpiB/LacA/LacB family sugar-phosphate isomerase [Alicyclobacillus cellulosilyticus]